MAGPFDQWPNGMGFEYFYGFVGGDTSQWQPNLTRNTTAIYPYVGKPGWNLTTAMADKAVGWIHQLHEVAPDKPFFCYYVPGGALVAIGVACWSACRPPATRPNCSAPGRRPPSGRCRRSRGGSNYPAATR